jgi:hypothetical protein
MGSPISVCYPSLGPSAALVLNPMVFDFVVLILNLNILVCMQTRDWP